jgi:flagellin-like protein
MRGQSEVIAALLMTAVVLVGFTIVWIYLYPRYLEWEQQASSTALESRLAASEWLVIGKASLGGGRLNLTLVNTGSVGLKVRAVYVNESLAWQGALSLAPGQQGDVTAPLPREGRVFWIKVCTARGNCWTFLETNWTAPVAAPPPSQPPQPPPSPYAKFEIADYTQTITGPVSSKQLFTATVRNTGSSSGTVVVEVRDSSGNLVNSSQATVPAGGTATISFYVTLPSSTGTYTWRVNAINQATGKIDDTKTVQVSVVTYLPVFSIVSYNSSISGPVGSRQKLVVTVQNTGNATGTVQVNIIDNNGNTVNSTTLSIPAGQTATATLTVTLPSNRGTYTWTVNAVNTATGAVDDSKSVLVTAKDIYLLSRSAITFSSFDTLPSWTQDPAGSWSVSGGVLTGTDKSPQNKAGSIIYNSSSTLPGSAYFLVSTQLSTTGHVHWGIIAASDTSNWIFAGVYTDTTYFYLEAYQVQNDRIAGQPRRSSPFSASGWATLFVILTPVSGGTQMSVTIYTGTGNYSSTFTLSASGRYPGLTVNDDDKKQYSRQFDNFVVSTSDPRIVTVTGLEQGWRVELYDSSGSLVASATADSSGKALLSVLAKPIITNGKIMLRDSSGNMIIERTFSQIVGGDTYTYGV